MPRNQFFSTSRQASQHESKQILQTKWWEYVYANRQTASGTQLPTTHTKCHKWKKTMISIIKSYWQLSTHLNTGECTQKVVLNSLFSQTTRI